MSKSDALYLLLGPEQGEKDAFIKRLIGRISKQIGQSPEIHRFYSFDSEVPEVLATLRNGSLFAPYRVALLNNVELLTGKGDLKQLAAYAEKPAPQSTLVMISEEIGRVDRRLEKLVPRENKTIFWELFENQKLGWIQNVFQKRNIRIDTQAASLLLEMVENNTRELRETCDKLTVFFGEGSSIGHDDVEKILYHSKEESVFTLFHRIAARNFEAALEVLSKLLLSREAEPVALLSGLLHQVRRLKTLKTLSAQGYAAQEAFTRAGIRGRRMQDSYRQGAGNYSLAEVQAIIQLLARFDYRFRALGAALSADLLQLLLYYWIVKGGSGNFRF